MVGNRPGERAESWTERPSLIVTSPASTLSTATSDTAFCDGEGARSFDNLLRRAQDALDRLESLYPESLVYVFIYGQFIQAVRSLVVDAGLRSQDIMRKFWNQGEPPAIGTASSWNWSGLRTKAGVPS